MIKKCMIALCSMLTLTSLWAAESLDGLVAVVNDSVVTQSELRNAIQLTKKQLMSMNTALPAADVLRKQVLTQLINRKLQMQAAEQAGMQVTDDDVKKAVESIAKSNNLSVKELYGKIAEQGMSQSAYLSNLREEILLQQIQQKEVGSRIVITPEDVNSFMHSTAWQAYNTKEYHLEDILIALPDAPTSEQVVDAKKRADALLVNIRKGVNFHDVAAAESGNNSALQGGDLGWRKLPEIPTVFADQLIHLKVNEVMGPIQAPNGFHLVKLAGIRGIPNTESAAAQRQQVQQLIFQRKMEEGIQNWVTRLRSAATINMHPEG